MNKIKVKLNMDLMGLKKGAIVIIGSKTYPMNAYWKNRMNDSKIDNCLTIIEDAKEKTVNKKPIKGKREDKNVD